MGSGRSLSFSLSSFLAHNGRALRGPPFSSIEHPSRCSHMDTIIRFFLWYCSFLRTEPVCSVGRAPRFGAREQRFDLTKVQLSSKLSPKDPKEFAKKFRDATGEPREKRLLQITNLKATLQRLHRLYIYHTEKRSGRATPEIFLFFLSVPCGGSFTHVVRVHVEPHAFEGFC